MTTPAGQMQVEIIADTAKFDATLKLLEARMSAIGAMRWGPSHPGGGGGGGSGGGGGYVTPGPMPGGGDDGERRARSWLDKVFGRMLGTLGAAGGAMLAARALDAGLKEIERSGDYAAAVREALRTVPLVGDFVSLFSTISDLVMNTAHAAALAAEAEADRLAQSSRLDAWASRASATNASVAAAVAANNLSGADPVMRAKLEHLHRTSGAEEEIQTLSAQTRDWERVWHNRPNDPGHKSNLARLQGLRALRDLSAYRRDAEIGAIHRANGEEQMERERARAETAARAQTQRGMDIAASIREQSRESSRARNDAQKWADAMSSPLEARARYLEAQRERAWGDTQSVGTSFGRFTFGSYTDAERRQLDRDSLAELKRIREAQEMFARMVGIN